MLGTRDLSGMNLLEKKLGIFDAGIHQKFPRLHQTRRIFNMSTLYCTTILYLFRLLKCALERSEKQYQVTIQIDSHTIREWYIANLI